MVFDVIQPRFDASALHWPWIPKFPKKIIEKKSGKLVEIKKVDGFFGHFRFPAEGSFLHIGEATRLLSSTTEVGPNRPQKN